MTAEPRPPFAPDWTIRPGVLLAELLRDRGLAPEDLAASGRLPLATVRGILDGTVPVDGPAAAGIALATGTSGQTWLGAQQVHDADLARGAKDVSGEYDDD